MKCNLRQFARCLAKAQEKFKHSLQFRQWGGVISGNWPAQPDFRGGVYSEFCTDSVVMWVYQPKVG